MKNINIAILNLTSGGFSGGYKKYMNNILPLLRKDNRIDNIKIIVPPESEMASFSAFETVLSWPVNDSLKGFPALKKTVDKLGVDVVFIPTARWINLGSMPTVVMVRNMEPLTVPISNNPIDEAFRNVLRRIAAKKASKKASRIIAVSNYVSNFLEQNWKIHPKKIGTVHHGTNLENENEELSKPKLMSQELKNGFVFTAGSIRPARGLEDVLEAVKVLVSKGNDSVRFVIAGDVNPRMNKYKKKLDEWILKNKIRKNLIWVGSLNEKEMKWCFKNCQSFVMTTRVEACPNIALEAMSFGKINIAANNPPLPEMFDNTARYYSPGNGEELAKLITEMNQMNGLNKKSIKENNENRIKKFTWELCAKKTVDELIKAI